MAEEPAKPADTTAPGPAAAFTEGQRGVFRSAGLWMMIVGWIELLGGTLMGVVWLLGFLNIAPQFARAMVGPSPLASEWAAAGISAVGGITIGVLTLIAASSFRRVEDPESATKAASNVQELYERQVWLFAIILAVLIGSAFVGR